MGEDARARARDELLAEIPHNLRCAPHFDEKWCEFVEWRSNERNRPMTPKARELTLHKLNRQAHLAVGALVLSMENDWIGVFPEQVAQQRERAARRMRAEAEAKQPRGSFRQ